MLEVKCPEGEGLSLKFKCSSMKLSHVVYNQLKNLSHIFSNAFMNLRSHETTPSKCGEWNLLAGPMW